jgi:hypothetical protein
MTAAAHRPEHLAQIDALVAAGDNVHQLSGLGEQDERGPCPSRARRGHRGPQLGGGAVEVDRGEGDLQTTHLLDLGPRAQGVDQVELRRAEADRAQGPHQREVGAPAEAGGGRRVVRRGGARVEEVPAVLVKTEQQRGRHRRRRCAPRLAELGADLGAGRGSGGAGRAGQVTGADGVGIPAQDLGAALDQRR